MTISDETLMAFSDGELSGEEHAAVERAIQENPELERRLARHRALRDRIKLAYSAELSDPVPERLLAAARRAASPPGGGKVVNLSDARAAVARQAVRNDAHAAHDESPHKPGWHSLGGIAAGILLGLGVGYGLWQQGGPVGRNADGALVARGALKSALMTQLAAEQTASAPVHIGISFRDKAGEYCRSFVLSGAGAPVGLACRRGGDWQLQSLMTGQPADKTGPYRTAGTEMPAPLLQFIESQIAGEPLDPAAEAAARRQGWQAPAR